MPARCTSCGGMRFIDVVDRRTQRIGGYDVTGDVPCTECVSCRERYFPAEVLARFYKAAAAALANAGASNGEALKFMRKVLGLTAAQLAELLNLTPESISHVETGRRAADRRTVALLTAMAIENLTGAPTTLNRLRALAKVEGQRESRIANYRDRLRTAKTPEERERLRRKIEGWRNAGPRRRLELAKLLAVAEG